jgi:Holliday junction resolvase-like predicted endonuclease
MLIRFIFSSFLVLSASVFSTSAFSSSVYEDFEKLKTLSQDYTVFGTICEEVARLRLEEKYGKEDYTFKIGIVYHGRGKTLGELDVIIFNKDDNEAIAIVEVKCWKNLHKAAQKANSQLRRFKTNVASGSIDSMESTSDNTAYDPNQFDESPAYMKMSQIGGIKAGFDMNIGLDLEEVKHLRTKLMLCQDRGYCPHPDRNN